MNGNILWLLLVVVGVWLGIEFAANSLGDWVFYLAGIVIAGLLVWTQRQIKQQKNIILLLTHRCDPEAFLEAYEAEMAKVKDPLQLDMLRINQGAGICYQGDFDRALKTLKAIDFDQLKGLYRAHYYNNLISVLILGSRDKEAQRTYQRGKEYLGTTAGNKELELAIQGTQGGIAYLNGEYQEASRLFTDLLKKSQTPLIDATSHLFLGRIEMVQQNQDLGQEHFRTAVALGGKTVIVRLAQRELKG